MRKLTNESVQKFLSEKPFKSGNTKVEVSNNVAFFYLHNNNIAQLRKGELFISTCGWRSNTTKERLNGILSALDLPTIYQKKGAWFFNNGESFEAQTKIFQLN